MANEILPLTAFQEKWRHWRKIGKRKVKWKSTLNVQIKMASTKRENCTRKRNYADARKFRKKNHNLTVVYVKRLCYQDTKTCFKMHSITAKDGKTWYLVQRTSFTIPLAIARLRMLRRANHRSRDEIFLTKSATPRWRFIYSFIGAVAERSKASNSGSNGCEFETTLGHQCWGDLSMLISIGYRKVVATSVV